MKTRCLLYTKHLFITFEAWKIAGRPLRFGMLETKWDLIENKNSGKMKTHIYSLLFIAAFFTLGNHSCKKSNAAFVTDDTIAGLGSPVLMHETETVVYLDDYFDKPVEFDSITGSDGLEIDIDKSARTLTLHEDGTLAPVSVLSFFSGKTKWDIPVYKTTKKKVPYSFDPGKNTYKTVQIKGDMNAWNPSSTVLKLENGVWKTDFYVVPGQYGYLLLLDGKEAQDPNNPKKIDNGMGKFNSLLEVPGVPEDKIPTLEVIAHEGNELIFEANQATNLVVLWNNFKIDAVKKGTTFAVTIPATADKYERSSIRAWAYNEQAGTRYTMIPLEKRKPLMDPSKLTRQDKAANIMYFVFLDRFYNGNTANDKKIDDPEIHPKANYLGGDLDGVIQKIKEGYFDKLGINNIWLSPIVTNPEKAYGLYDVKGIRSKFSAYHGYWPTSFTKVNPHFGDSLKLKELIDLAHSKNMNVVLDFVAHHVHETHPVYMANKDKGWTTDLYLPDGTLNTEKWDEHRLTTWFDVFLPTLNLEKQEITEMVSDSAMFWLKAYDFDGFRHDATKHIPEIFWRTLTKKVKAYEKETGKSYLQLGETYGTPELISSYIGSGMLDGQFDFNVYDAISTAVTQDQIGFENVARRLKQSQEYYGTNHIMGNMSGNQDRTRIMALATGEVKPEEDSKYAGWSRNIRLRNETGFKKVGLVHAINMTIPGIPVVYYGDEIGLTGGNDPDNRRMMYFDKWNALEKSLADDVAMTARLRKSKMSLLYGNLNFLLVEKDVLVYSRKYFDDFAIILINNSNKPRELSVNIPPNWPVKNLKNLKKQTFSLTGQTLMVKLPAHSFEIIYN